MGGSVTATGGAASDPPWAVTKNVKDLKRWWENQTDFLAAACKRENIYTYMAR